MTDEGPEIIFLPVALSPSSPQPLKIPLGQAGFKVVIPEAQAHLFPAISSAHL